MARPERRFPKLSFRFCVGCTIRTPDLLAFWALYPSEPSADRVPALAPENEPTASISDDVKLLFHCDRLRILG